MKILLLDDHALFRCGLRLLLGTLGHDTTIYESGGIQEALVLAGVHPDLQLCLLDLNLHHEDGFVAFEALRSQCPDIAIVVVSANDERSVVRRCLDAGAMSFISKSAAPEVLADALKYVLAGSIYLPAGLFEPEIEPTTQHIPLSARQRDVLRGLCLGQSTKSIARTLALSDYTVKDYIASLFRLLNVHNRTEAVIKAGQLKLLQN